MPGGCVSCLIALPRHVRDVEAPRKGALFHSEQARVCYLVQRAISEDLHQGFMVRYDDEVIAPLGEVSCLLEAPGDGQGFTFDGRVALLSRG